MKKLKVATGPKKPVASVRSNVTVITDPAVKFAESMLFIIQKISNTHWSNFTDMEVVQMMTLRRIIIAKVTERMGGA